MKNRYISSYLSSFWNLLHAMPWLYGFVNFLFYNVCLAVKYFFLIFKALSVHHNVIPVVCVPGKKMSSPSHFWNKRRVLVCQYWLISLLKHALFIRRHKTNHRGKTLAQFETTRHKPCSICVCVYCIPHYPIHFFW